MTTAVQLYQQPSLGHPLAAKTVLGRAPAAGTADASLGENAPHGGPAQVDPFPFPQQLGEVSVVGALVALSGQFHHHGSLRGWDSVVGSTAAVAMCQRGGAVFAIGGQHAAGVALGHSQQLGGLVDGHLVFQNGVEHGQSGLFFLVQRHILHKPKSTEGRW